MFCYNCGAKLIDGSKFCSECGTKLMQVKNEGQNSDEEKQEIILPENQKEEVTSYNNDEEVSEDEIKEYVIANCFEKYFNLPRQFGEKVYITGRDTYTEKMQQNIKRYYLKDEDEFPLLVFDYNKNVEEGFAITNKNFVFYYNLTGVHSIDLTEIKDVVPGRAVLAKVMKLVTFDGVISDQIYLTGINNEDKFVSQFTKFIDDIYYTLYDDGTEDDASEHHESEVRKEGVENKVSNMDIDQMIDNACKRSGINSQYCEMGSPIIPQYSKKYYNALKYFGFPTNEKVYLILDTTVLGGCKKGFAICSNGIYFCEGRQGFIPWSTYKNMNISKRFGSIKIESIEFNASGDSKKLFMILEEIKGHL